VTTKEEADAEGVKNPPKVSKLDTCVKVREWKTDE
jgi:hypothetical protein